MGRWYALLYQPPPKGSDDDLAFSDRLLRMILDDVYTEFAT
jgi:hypothetical protein